MDTQGQFEQIMKECRELFAKKLHDYGAAWRIMRPASVTDQIVIKANRIRGAFARFDVEEKPRLR